MDSNETKQEVGYIDEQGILHMDKSGREIIYSMTNSPLCLLIEDLFSRIAKLEEKANGNIN